MSDVGEGIGGAIEGVLAGRAVEPKHGEAGADGEGLAPKDCPNCGTSAASTFCPACGQRRQVHRSLTAIFHDLIHGVLHLDGKFWLTLPLLVFKPGRLTRRYIDGERAKFVSPMAMFLFSVFAMFAVFQMVGLTVPANLGGGLDVAAEAMRDEGESQLEILNARLEAMPANDPERSEVEGDIAALETGLREFEQRAEVQVGEDGSVDFRPTGVEAIDNGLIQKWMDNPSLMLYKLQANGYKFSWLLIPLSIPFVWLLFAWRRQFKAYDHAIFVTYSLAFMSLLFIAISLIGLAGLDGGVTFLLFTTVAPLHVYKHLKYTYDLGRAGTIWRLLVLIFFINIVLVMFLQALLLLGAF